jgi:monoamine oxidase
MPFPSSRRAASLAPPAAPRRVVLLLGLGALLAGCGGDPAVATPTPNRRVVVVGAGLAGLTAAVDLRDAGWEVVVLEARDRVGGRVHTLHDPFTGGLHAEAGGESIDDNHGSIQALVKRYGLSLEQRPPDKQLDGAVLYQGARAKIGAFALQDPATSAGYTGFYDALAALAQGLDPEHPQDFSGAAALDGKSLGDFIKEQGLTPQAEFLVTVAQRGGYNADPADVSLLFAAQQTAAVASVPDSAAETRRITGGNGLLPEAMARDLGSRVTLGAAVTRVEEQADHVHVIAGSATFDAAFAVLAVPTPPLRKITFEPPLEGDLGLAVAQVDLGQAAKVITQYDTPFWTAEGLSGFTITDLPFGIGWAPTDSYDNAAGLLTQFITGTPAKDAAALDDATRISQLQEQLDTVYPEGVAHRTAHAATIAWASEPWTGGGYTVYGPGQMARFWPAFRAGTARLRFAGEHTEPLAGYMESAVRAGHRVAAEIGAPPP